MSAAALALLLPVALAGAWLTALVVRQDRLIFRPGPPLDRTPATIGLRYEELRLSAGDTSVTGWWVEGRAGRPAVLYFHGSEGNVTHELPAVRFLHSLGVSILLVEYVGYLDDRRPSEDGCYAPAASAWEHVTGRRGFAEERVILFGHSLGACVAARGAAGRRCAGLVLQSGFTSMRELARRAFPFLPVDPFLRTRMDTLAPVARAGCAVLVIHSRDDEHIPYEHGRRLFDAAPGPKKLVTLRGSHFGQELRSSPEVRGAWRELLARDFRTWTVGPEAR